MKNLQKYSLVAATLVVGGAAVFVSLPKEQQTTSSTTSDGTNITANAGELNWLKPTKPTGSPAKSENVKQPTEKKIVVKKKPVKKLETVKKVTPAALVKKYFPANQVGNAMAIMLCESDGKSSLVNTVNSKGAKAWGLFQLADNGRGQKGLTGAHIKYINNSNTVGGMLLNPENNVKAAKALYDMEGWQGWLCAYKTKVTAFPFSNTPGSLAGHYTEDGVVDKKYLEEQKKLKEKKAKKKAAAEKKAKKRAVVKKLKTRTTVKPVTVAEKTDKIKN